MRCRGPLFGIGACLWLGACTSPSSPSQDEGEESGADETSTSTDEGGDGDGDGDSGSPPEPPPPPPPLAPHVDPTELEVGQWMYATVADESSDPVAAVIDADEFELPPEGDYAGTFWQVLEPSDNGDLFGTNSDLLYAATELEVPEGQFVFDRADTVRGVFANNAWEKPGDVYASGRYRFPVVTQAGTNLIAVQAYGRRGVPQVEFFATPDEMVFNFNDATLPNLPVGDSGEQWVGVPILNLRDIDSRHLNARVIESEYFEGTVVQYPSISAGATTQLAFQLVPKQAWDSSMVGETVTVRLRLEPLWYEHSYEREVELTVVAADANQRRTRRSQVDHSAQLMGVLPPPDVDAARDYGLILSLHGAGVYAPGQSGSYSAKDWAYLVAPTNRRRYGFDWEEWGRLDAIEAYDWAKATFAIDPTRTHLTGHSMGGHGSWNVGVHYPTRFGVVAPSAGWISFDTYGGGLIGDGIESKARASSKTRNYIDNFAQRSIYIIHGLADTNVPAAQAQIMFDLLEPFVSALQYHAEPGAGHWWDADPDEPGADCVDWEPMISVMETTTLDPVELDFEFVCAGPWVNGQHSFARIMSAATPMEDSRLAASSSGSTVTLTTTNVRSLRIDMAALASKGVTELVVDGQSHAVEGERLDIGPTDGKQAEVYGPLNQAFHRPWLFVYDPAGPIEYREYASFLTSWWAAIGNGHAGTVALDQLEDEDRAAYNLLYLGIPTSQLGIGPDMQVEWEGQGIRVAGNDFPEAAMAFVFPEGDKLSAAWMAEPGSEYLLFRYQPFSSRNGKPDYYLWQANGTRIGGFFDNDWKLDPSLSGAI